MSVATKVIQGIPSASKGKWNQIPLTCHFSTVFWLYWEAFGKQPTQKDILNLEDGVTVLMTSMFKTYGTKVSRPGKVFGKTLPLPAGTILVFERQKVARHSCIVIKKDEIGGCNQVDWFSTPGAVNTFTTHKFKDLQWHSGLFHGTEIKGGHHWCHLYKISEKDAIKAIKEAF